MANPPDKLADRLEVTVSPKMEALIVKGNGDGSYQVLTPDEAVIATGKKGQELVINGESAPVKNGNLSSTLLIHFQTIAKAVPTVIQTDNMVQISGNAYIKSSRKPVLRPTTEVELTDAKLLKKNVQTHITEPHLHAPNAAMSVISKFPAGVMIYSEHGEKGSLSELAVNPAAPVRIEYFNPATNTRLLSQVGKKDEDAKRRAAAVADIKFGLTARYKEHREKPSLATASAALAVGIPSNWKDPVIEVKTDMVANKKLANKPISKPIIIDSELGETVPSPNPLIAEKVSDAEALESALTTVTMLPGSSKSAAIAAPPVASGNPADASNAAGSTPASGQAKSPTAPPASLPVAPPAARTTTTPPSPIVSNLQRDKALAQATIIAKTNLLSALQNASETLKEMRARYPNITRFGGNINSDYPIDEFRTNLTNLENKIDIIGNKIINSGTVNPKELTELHQLKNQTTESIRHLREDKQDDGVTFKHTNLKRFADSVTPEFDRVDEQIKAAETLLEGAIKAQNSDKRVQHDGAARDGGLPELVEKSALRAAIPKDVIAMLAPTLSHDDAAGHGTMMAAVKKLKDRAA